MKCTALAILLTLVAFSPVSSATQLSWRTDFDTALLEAQKTSKPLFIDVYADWCEWCHKLDKDVYSDPAFLKYIANYVSVKIDAEDSKKGTAFAEKYHVDGFPTMLVTDSN